MLMFRVCDTCGSYIKDKDLLKFNEVWPVNCPVCGNPINAWSANESDDDIIISDTEEGENTVEILDTLPIIQNNILR